MSEARKAGRRFAPLAPLPDALIEPIVRAALAEDLGRAGDITSAAVVPSGTRVTAALNVRRGGTIAGATVAARVFTVLDPSIAVEVRREDGRTVAAGETVAVITGDARAILAAERVALNFVGHLSGVATATADLVRRVERHKARICCTRKTLPGLRALEKYAVRAGGGVNHRFGLDDGVLIKDNHVAIAGGVGPAIARARAAIGHMVRIEVEVDRLDQIEEALAGGVDAILLDNMEPERLEGAVALIAGRALAEASGNVTPENVADIAGTGVDLISAGWITHSAQFLDVGLDCTL